MIDNDYYIGYLNDQQVNVIVNKDGKEVFNNGNGIFYDGVYKTKEDNYIIYSNKNNHLVIYSFNGTKLEMIKDLNDVSYAKPIIYTNGNIEYGIKSARASTFSLKQIIKIAYQIINDENFSQEKLEKIKAEFAAKGRTRNKEQKSIEKSVIEAVVKIMDTNR